MQHGESLASGQRSMGDPAVTYPLWPPLVEGCPETSTDEVQYPLEVDYRYERVDSEVFEQPPLPGIDRYSPLLPPLPDTPGLEEGGTPLVRAAAIDEELDLDREVYVKDESRNPTWSHKDRLNRCTLGAAIETESPGTVVASSGNHGASAAAYAAHANLPCIVLTSTADVAGNISAFLRSYGAAVLAVPREDRWPVMREIVDRLDYHPISNLTETHTGHPFGPEGYKTIAYETYQQLGRTPGTVFVPTGYAELLYGVWKGFRELRELGITATSPKVIACEPAARAPLSKALSTDEPAATVENAQTEAYSIRVTVSGYRGVRAIEESGGYAIELSDDALIETRELLATRVGLWQETAGAAGVAGLRAAIERGEDVPGPVVCIATSSGFKNRDDRNTKVPDVEPNWEAVTTTLREEYGLEVA
jgi:threonine synthase